MLLGGAGPGAHFPLQLLHIFPGILVSTAYFWSVASPGWRSPGARHAGWEACGDGALSPLSFRGQGLSLRKGTSQPGI